MNYRLHRLGDRELRFSLLQELLEPHFDFSGGIDRRFGRHFTVLAWHHPDSWRFDRLPVSLLESLEDQVLLLFHLLNVIRVTQVLASPQLLES